MVNLCKDMLEKKYEEAENIRLRLRKFQKDEEVRKKRELDEGLKTLAEGKQKLQEDQATL